MTADRKPSRSPLGPDWCGTTAIAEHWVNLTTRPDDGTGRTALASCACGAWASDWLTPVEAFDAGAEHTASEQDDDELDASEWVSELDGPDPDDEFAYDDGTSS